jgi:hypothetical protein
MLKVNPPPTMCCTLVGSDGNRTFTVPGSIFEEVFAICERLGVNALQ